MKQEIPGGARPIAFDRDALGYPRITAESYRDATYAIGYLQAKDRLTQIALLHLAARGQLMTVLGDKPLPRLIDRSMRLMGGDRALEREVAALDDGTRQLMKAYCAGFKAATKGRRWPLLLRLLGVKPFEYTEATIAAVFRLVTYFGLTSMQFSSELIVAQLMARGVSRKLLAQLLGRSLDGLDTNDASSLEVPPEFSFFDQPSGGSPMAGSNAFAVSAERSKTGGALLMGEFHMEIGKWPPVVYACHVDLPEGQYISGMTVPGLAWFVAGRTKHVGWSYTFAHGDNVDILMEKVKDESYLRNGTLHPFRVREETLKIRGKKPETLRFYENEYGTLLGDARAEGVRPCVRFSGVSENHRSFATGKRIVECRNVEELAAVHREIRGVSLEAILADSSGQIASVVTGQMDARPPGWTGAYPRRAWDLPVDAPPPVSEALRPCVLRPPSGVLASANQGGQGEHRDNWCKFPEPRYREERLRELLGGDTKHDLNSLLRVSYDTYDAGARRMLAVWEPLLPDELLARRLLAWRDKQQEPHLAALYTTLHEELYFQLLEEELPREIARQVNRLGGLVFFEHHIDDVLALEHPELLDRNTLQRLLASAFPVAAARFEAGPYPIRTRFAHLLGRGKTPQWLGLDSQAVTLPGGPCTLFQCRFADVEGEPMIYGPAFHLAFDMSRPGAWYNIPGGASESRFGAGYGKGLDEWLGGVLLPLGQDGAPLRLQDGSPFSAETRLAPSRPQGVGSP